MRSQNPKKPRLSTDLNEVEASYLKAFAATYTIKHPRAKGREVRRAAEKEFNIKIVDKQEADNNG